MATDSARYLLIFLEDIPGKDVKKLLSTASIYVEIGGPKIAPWRKDMVSAIVVEGKIVWAKYGTYVAFVCSCWSVEIGEP